MFRDSTATQNFYCQKTASCLEAADAVAIWRLETDMRTIFADFLRENKEGQRQKEQVPVKGAFERQAINVTRKWNSLLENFVARKVNAWLAREPKVRTLAHCQGGC